MSALKPCPFCGCRFIDPAEWRDATGREGPGCPDCGAIGRSGAAWNRRAPAEPSEPVAVVCEIFGSPGAALTNAGHGLPIGTRLYAHPAPAEPTDEMVEAALAVYDPECCAVDERRNMRAALRAALGVGQP